ncbi:deoxyribose-phosphate aldolase [Microbacterium sp. VKM Ac-2870]|uniref:deoxyribose-phosphate aldolase n=1 Tax=Microbacterium sp. VKM Ac-2870 TaxID=2783825 RepID=UPI00188B79EB|nr:deoxyribose-phosphate aldolase [Microbacterium sp. VKM Ac-2870]MBF4560980.1 deoxyribose-phosphate aldolase [Microbacterium sp. VKM Ac-2870]
MSDHALPTSAGVDLRVMIDHTLLTPEVTAVEVGAHVREAIDLGLRAVCVRPTLIPADAYGLRVVTVCGFPSGAHDSRVKALEAELAPSRGADEIDMVVDLGAVKSHDWIAVRRDLDVVRAVVPREKTLKVIIESAALSDDEIIRSSEIGAEAGADYIKTSTGYHPAGGASVSAVALIARVVGPHVGVKASGGIRTRAQAIALVNAGASRLGVSSTRALLADDAAEGVPVGGDAASY